MPRLNAVLRNCLPRWASSSDNRQRQHDAAPVTKLKLPCVASSNKKSRRRRPRLFCRSSDGGRECSLDSRLRFRRKESDEIFVVPSRSDMREEQLQEMWWRRADYVSFRAAQQRSGVEEAPSPRHLNSLHVRADSLTSDTATQLCFCKAPDGMSQYQIGTIDADTSGSVSRSAAGASFTPGPGSFPFFAPHYSEDCSDSSSNSSDDEGEDEYTTDDLSELWAHDGADYDCVTGFYSHDPSGKAPFCSVSSPATTEPLSERGSICWGDKLLQQWGSNGSLASWATPQPGQVLQ
ncbi:hypothetical protein JKP88DRAFT_263396 [Tribonema minus]|uniref:Uncharacterized protein n=1 Tax=Tribonema minus TaxID=303371 RepID=A0A835YUX6_9STRA|nr:hypothetical protein JKP88DRAFT_263396 [Tribonema minus]